jgi:hypothetical protein
MFPDFLAFLAKMPVEQRFVVDFDGAYGYPRALPDGDPFAPLGPLLEAWRAECESQAAGTTH